MLTDAVTTFEAVSITFKGSNQDLSITQLLKQTFQRFLYNSESCYRPYRKCSPNESKNANQQRAENS